MTKEDKKYFNVEEFLGEDVTPSDGLEAQIEKEINTKDYKYKSIDNPYNIPREVLEKFYEKKS